MGVYALNGLPIHDCRLLLPLGGCWTADVITASPAPLALVVGTAVSLELDALTFTGTVVQGNAYRTSEYVRIIGGRAGLRTLATPQGFANATWRQIVSSLLQGAGETLSSASDAALLAAVTDSWAIVQSWTSVALTRVANALSCTWRIRPDGSIWFGTDSFTAATLTEPDLLDASPEQGELVVGITRPELLPGQSLFLEGTQGLLGGQVTAIEYRILPSAYRMRVWYR